jgi:hypothetical protein
MEFPPETIASETHGQAVTIPSGTEPTRTKPQHKRQAPNAALLRAVAELKDARVIHAF